MSTLLIEHGTLVTLDEQGAIIDDGSVLIDGDTIVAAGHLDGVAADRVIDARGRIVMPGLINVHHHFYSTLARGFTPPGEPAANFQQILERLWWKVDRALEPEDVTLSAQLPLIEAIRAGCTTIVDHHASPGCVDGSLDLIAAAFREAGLSGCLCYEVSDRNRPGEGIEENTRFLKACRASGDGQVTGLFGLHASMTLGPETLARCAAEAAALGAGVHVHIDEAECDGEESLRRFGARPVARFHEAGLIGPRSLFAHGIHLDEEGMRFLAEGGAMLATNPESNMNNGLEVTPLLELLRAGVLVGLGTDGMSNRLIAQARAAYLIQRAVRRDPRVAFVEACRLLLDHNRTIAGRLFPEPRGRLAAGHLADVILLDYTPFTPLEPATFYGHLLFGLIDAPVSVTIARGRVLLEDGVIPHLDETRVRRRAVERARALWKRIV